MLKVLAIDTAAGACSVAAIGAGARVARSVATERGHAEMLMGLVRDALDEAGFGFAALDLVAVTTGPGSFTGLRVGLASARGVALAAGLPCLGVTTLEALACSTPWPEDGSIRLAAIDTKRGTLYAQAFAAAEQPITTPAVIAAHALSAYVAGGHLSVIGDGAEAAAAGLRAAGRTVAIEPLRFPCPLALADLAVRRWTTGIRPHGGPAPFYLQAPVIGAPAGHAP